MLQCPCGLVAASWLRGCLDFLHVWTTMTNIAAAGKPTHRIMMLNMPSYCGKVVFQSRDTTDQSTQSLIDRIYSTNGPWLILPLFLTPVKSQPFFKKTTSFSFVSGKGPKSIPAGTSTKKHQKSNYFQRFLRVETQATPPAPLPTPQWPWSSALKGWRPPWQSMVDGAPLDVEIWPCQEPISRNRVEQYGKKCKKKTMWTLLKRLRKTFGCSFFKI